MISFKNLLIKGLKETRWGSFFDSIQELIQEYKDTQINKIKYKFNIIQSEIDNLKDLILMRGFPLFIYTGYTATKTYLQRRNQSLTFERLFRCGEESYKYILKSFFLMGNVFSLRKNQEGIFVVVRDPVESLSSSSFSYFTSDQEVDIIEYYLPGNIPVPNPPTESTLPILYLDSEDLPTDQRILFLDTNEIRAFTNHFIVEYEFITIEDTDTFQSSFTSEAFYRTVDASKKLKEIPHFQPHISVSLTGIYNIVNEIEYTSYDNINTSLQKNIWITGDLLQVSKVQIGKGRRYEIGTIPFNQCDIIVSTYSPLTAYFNIIDQTSNILDIEYLTYEYSKLGIAATGAITGQQETLEFSEVSLLSSTDNLIAYAYFPTVNFSPNMYTSVRFDFSIPSITGI